MGLSNSQYETIKRSFEQKQLRNHDLMIQHYKDVTDKLPHFRDLDNSIAELAVRTGHQLLNGDDDAVFSMKKELASLRAEKAQLLTSAGFPPDYLDSIYDCPNCEDTGYVGNEKCRCFKQAVIGLLYEQSNLTEILAYENFEHFSMDYYSSNFIDPKTKRSSYDIMNNALNVCKDFVSRFNKNHDNLFLYGDTGVGKTFLSHCIAKELMDQAFSAIYFSAPGLFNLFAKSTFEKDRDAANMYDYIYQCDLLIIDDLGTELTNAFVTSQFFACINERLLHKKSTIISTNLGLDSLRDIYSERTFSRITSNYTMLKLIGDDIRIKKKLMNREDA